MAFEDHTKHRWRIGAVKEEIRDNMRSSWDQAVVKGTLRYDLET